MPRTFSSLYNIQSHTKTVSHILLCPTHIEIHKASLDTNITNTNSKYNLLIVLPSTESDFRNKLPTPTIIRCKHSILLIVILYNNYLSHVSLDPRILYYTKLYSKIQ